MKLRLASLALVCTLSGCVVWYGAEYYPSAQLKLILNHEDTSQPMAGRITPSFQPAKDQPVTHTPTGGYPLAYEGIKDGKICFLTTGEGSYTDDGRETRADADAYVHKKFNQDNFFVEARTTLEFSGALDRWPDALASQLSVDITERGRKHVRNVFSDVSETRARGTHVSYDVELCGEAPVIPPGAKGMTVMRVPKKQLAGLGAKPSLFVWLVDPAAVPADEDVAPPSPQEGATAPGDGVPKRPIATDDLMITLKRDGRFSTFLKLLAATDFAEKLAGPGRYALFVPTDEALAKTPNDVKKWMKDKKLLNKIVKSHIVGGNRDKATILEASQTSTGSTKLQDLLGNYFVVKPEAETFRVGKRSSVIFPELPASNGVIYPLDSTVQ